MYAVIDLETTAKSSYKRTANPFDSANRIVAVGLKTAKDTDVWIGYDNLNEVDNIRFSFDITTLVGHNLKFDLLYLWKYNWFQDWLKNGGKVWDTQLAEHILTGQQSGMTSLNELSIKYGGTLKDDKVTVMFKAGMGSDEVPKELLLEYLKHDILNTEIVLKNQVKQAKEQGMFKLIVALMDGYLATTEMEYNGMFVNEEVIKEDKEIIRKELEGIEQDLHVLISESKWPKEVEFNFDSKDHLSALIYGGIIKHKTREVVYDEEGQAVRFKTGDKAGQEKSRNTENQIKLGGYICPTGGQETKKDGVFSVDESSLCNISKSRTNSGFIRDLITKLLEYRRLSKLFNTYYEAINDLRMPHDSCIHHQLSHVTTLTGRLSGRNPNQQNIPGAEKSGVKKMFTSRFGDDGVIMEFDYSQLEVVGLAFLAQDKTLIEEIKSGVDMHLENAALLFNKPKEEVTKNERKLTKRFTFGLTYGQQAFGMADANDVSKDVAQEFIDKFYEKYHGVRRYHEELAQEIKFNRVATKELLAHGIQKGKSVYQSCTGRKYIFWESMRTNYYGTKIGFSEPDIKNYPVQGLATGDIVPIMVGKVWRRILSSVDTQRIKLINTIHDSLMLDVDNSVHKPGMGLAVVSILESVPQMMKEIFNVDFNVPVKVESSFGKSWWHSEMGINNEVI